jgi:hypothetical protein
MKNRKKYDKAYFERHKDAIRKRKREWAVKWRKEHPILARMISKKNSTKYKVKRRAYTHKYSQSYKGNPIKVKARATLNNAIKRGEIIKPKGCSRCQNWPVEGHHPDYTKPLKVLWLCRECHSFVHHPIQRIDELLPPSSH